MIYRNRYGETPAKTLAKTRLSYARKLFDCYGEAISVSECAYRCGFGDALYFPKIQNRIRRKSARIRRKRTEK